jgi:hypothetical protein
MRGEEMKEKSVELAQEMEERALDMRVISSLEARPDLSDSIPADFAARVAAHVPARRATVAAAVPSHVGRVVMWVCLVVLLVALLFVGRGSKESVVSTALDWILFAQFLGLAVWLGVRQWRSN